MPLQNRVDPFGHIHAVSARGLFTGNRGVIHDPEKQILLSRRWTTKAWIICDCGFRQRKRIVMGRNRPSGGPGWTNLFFLDEVTALAAGHRPCFECRRDAARDFADSLAESLGRAVAAAQIDALLHPQRIAAGAIPPLLGPAAFQALPDGAMIAAGETVFALRAGKLLPWSFEGYGPPNSFAALKQPLRLLTPPLTVAALTAGFRPVWHPSAQAI